MNTKAKPFIKWVGGKRQLIDQLEAKLPADFDNWDNVTYIEPFVGGGAMLFYMLQQHPNIKRAVINDINSDFYFDPPYRPLSDTSSFNDYTKEAFNDESQVRLKEFCDKVVA